MATEHPIYSRIDYEDAMQAKKNMLRSQMNLLNIIKKLEEYKRLRKQELMLKLKLKNDLGEVKAKINKILDSAPKTEMTKNMPKQIEPRASHITQIRKEHEQENSHELEPRKIGIEAQLNEIRERLEKLG